MRESKIEKYFKDEVTKIGGTAYKFKSPGRSKVPDRLVLIPGGRVYFVELKATGKDPDEGQAREIKRLREMGFNVRSIDSKLEVNIFIDEVREW